MPRLDVSSWIFASLFASLFVAVATLSTGCDDGDTCRFHPELCEDGRAGAFCEDDDDCRGVCCTEDANCAGGMCTFTCDDDEDCPVDMACEHDVCFYRCEIDQDCAEGQTCEHGDTVCEWP